MIAYLRASSKRLATAKGKEGIDRLRTDFDAPSRLRTDFDVLRKLEYSPYAPYLGARDSISHFEVDGAPLWTNGYVISRGQFPVDGPRGPWSAESLLRMWKSVNSTKPYNELCLFCWYTMETVNHVIFKLQDMDKYVQCEANALAWALRRGGRPVLYSNENTYPRFIIAMVKDSASAEQEIDTFISVSRIPAGYADLHERDTIF